MTKPTVYWHAGSRYSGKVTLAIRTTLAVSRLALVAWLGNTAVGNPQAQNQLIDAPAVSEILIQIDDAGAGTLRQSPRQEVPGQIRVDGMVFSRVGVHLKGSVGSFRTLDDKPSITVDLDRFAPDQSWRGTTKIHLNNSIEDPSYMCEWLGSEVFRSAGIAVPRVGHAVVWLNGRPLGLYVLKEGFTRQFLEREYSGSKSIILEPESGQDVDGRWEVRAMNSGGGQQSGASELNLLAAAAQESDLSKRWQRLDSTLDVNQFLTFLCIEILLGHRDGYALARNNFRAKIDLESHRVQFLPHGMDQLFPLVDLPWQPHWAGLVARSLMETPEGRARYADVFSNQLAHSLDVEGLTNRMRQVAARLRPFIAKNDLARWERETADLAQRMVARQESMELQLNRARLAKLDFSNGPAVLTGWEPPKVASGGTRVESANTETVPSLHLIAGPPTSASWRKSVHLPRGRYRFEGNARTAGVEPLPFGRNQGAALRMAGAEGRSEGLLSNTEWRRLVVESRVDSDREVELLCELRGSAGEAWFDLATLRLTKLE